MAHRAQGSVNNACGIKTSEAAVNKTVQPKVGDFDAKSIAGQPQFGLTSVSFGAGLLQLRAAVAVLAILGLRELVVSSCASSTRFNIAACAAFGSEALTASYTF